MKISTYYILILVICTSSCSAQQPAEDSSADFSQIQHIAKPAADFPELYLPFLKDQRVGLVVNQTSRVEDMHMVDYLLQKQINIVKIFTPEHGYRGTAAAGEKISNERDAETDIEIVSLYGKTKKPADSDLEGIDLLLFDIQDVGVRFYTYISTLHYVMEACAQNDMPLLVLDRPNPHADYIDGPVLNPAFSSFIGMHPVPVVYGMTIGEYAKMINGESWLEDGIKCDLSVVSCPGYQRDLRYVLPVRPSPNLPTENSILLYPSLCFFEGTVVSAGRGTAHPFESYGHPDLAQGNYSFTPIPNAGAKYPKHEGLECNGQDLSSLDAKFLLASRGINLFYLLDACRDLDLGKEYFLPNLFIDKLAGTDQLRNQILENKTEKEIKSSWKEGLDSFQLIREKYLIYPLSTDY